MFEHTKLTTEWGLLENAFHRFYHRDSHDMGERIMDIKSAVNRFTRLYENDLPGICSFLKMNYLFMDNNSLDILIDEHEIEVIGLIKKEEKQKKLQEIQEAGKHFLA